MKISRGTIQVLKNFSALNKGVMIEAGNRIRTITSIGRSVLVDAALKDTFPVERGGAISDLPKFLGALSLYDEPELSFSDEEINIRGADSSVSYIFSDESMILRPNIGDMNLCSGLFATEEQTVVAFDLSQNQLASMQRGSGVMGLSDILVRVQDGNHVEMEAVRFKYRNESDKFRMRDIPCKTSCDPGTEFRYALKNLQLLPVDYHIDISAKGITQFVGCNMGDLCDSLTYFVAVER